MLGAANNRYIHEQTSEDGIKGIQPQFLFNSTMFTEAMTTQVIRLIVPLYRKTSL